MNRENIKALMRGKRNLEGPEWKGNGIRDTESMVSAMDVQGQEAIKGQRCGRGTER